MSDGQTEACEGNPMKRAMRGGLVRLDGKYRTRSGKEVRIYATDCGGEYPIHGAFHDGSQWKTNCWRNHGQSWHLAGNDHDLIEIPPEPTYRPFTPEELPRIVGRRVRKKDTGDVRVLDGCDGYLIRIYAVGYGVNKFFSEWQFLDYDSDGNEIVTPCGVMEEA